MSSGRPKTASVSSSYHGTSKVAVSNQIANMVKKNMNIHQQESSSTAAQGKKDANK